VRARTHTHHPKLEQQKSRKLIQTLSSKNVTIQTLSSSKSGESSWKH